MTHSMEKNNAFQKRAEAVLPFGVSSNFRYWGDGENIGVARAKGTYIWDLDGNRYIDYRLGYGPVILGHGHPAVVERVAEAIKQRHGLCPDPRAGGQGRRADRGRCARAWTRCALPTRAPRRPCTPCASPAPTQAGKRSSSSKGSTTACTTMCSFPPPRRRSRPWATAAARSRQPTSSGIPKAIHELVIPPALQRLRDAGAHGQAGLGRCGGHHRRADHGQHGAASCPSRAGWS